MCKPVTGKTADPEHYSNKDIRLFNCKLACCQTCHFCSRAFPKERNKSRESRLSIQRSKIKICEKCFVCHSVVLCPTCNMCPKCCSKSTCRGQTSKILGNMAGSRCRSESSSNPERGLHSSLSDPDKSDKVSLSRKLLCQSSQEQLPVRGITSAYRQKCCRIGPQSNISGVFQPALSSPETHNKWRPILDLSKLNLFLKTEKFKMETPETIRTSLQQGEWVTSIDFKDAYFHIPIQEQSRKYLRFHVQGRTYQFKALPFGLSTAPLEFTVVAKEVKLMAIHKGIRIHQYLDDWLVRARSRQACLQHTRDLVRLCQNLGWLVNLEKSELEPKQIFDFVGYQFDLKAGWVRPTPDRWQNLQDKILEIVSLPTCPVRQFMSLIGLLTATEKQVHLDRLHMRPIQWHLKNNWRVPESLEKVIPVPRSLHPHLRRWLEEDNVFIGQVPTPPFKKVVRGRQCFHRPAFTPNKICPANLYRRIKRRVGRSLKRAHCKGLLVSARKQAAHKLPRAKSSLFSSKGVPRPLHRPDSLGGNRQHHSGVLHKQGGRHEVRPSLCPIVVNPDLVLQEAGDSQSPTHPRSPKRGSRQAITTGPDNSNRVVPPSRGFSSNLQQMAPASNSLFDTRFNNKLPLFVSPVPDPQATAVDALSLPWEDLDAYAFPPTAILGKVVEKLQDSTCTRIILIARGWPNMPWFWDLVTMSSQVPLSLPNLLTQPFNQIPHRNLTNLNLHAWLLEPQRSRNTASLRQWQQELKLLRGDQQDQSMRLSGPFLQSGVSLIR